MAKQSQAVKSAAHPFWSGSIGFGLVSVPVQLYPANRRTQVRFRFLDHDGTPVQRRYYCPEHKRDIHPEHILRGYEGEDGTYVIVRDEELEKLEPKKSSEIELQKFVPRSQIPPSLFDQSYFLIPAGKSTKAYRLLADAIERSGLAGVATFVMRDREYLVAILAEDGIIEAETLRFHDDLRDPAGIGLPPKQRLDTTTVSALKRAIKVRGSEKLDFTDLQDEYSAAVRKLAEQKKEKGADMVQIDAPAEAEDEDATERDILATIRQILQRGNGKSNGAAASK